MSYFDDIRDGVRTTVKGLKLTLAHIRQATKRRTPAGIASDTYFDLQNGLVTLQYPHEQLPIPDNGRYKLRNQIDDCIVCDKCAKVCPVDCITIDAIKATEEVGKASDGSPIRLYAATFDIDMAKCCYCGLCTVVCPTECLTMDKEFDYSEFDLGKLTYHFSDLTPQQADEKRSLYEQFVREKEAAKQAAKATAAPADPTTAKPRPAFRPTAKPAPSRSEEAAEKPQPDATPDEMQQIAQGGLEAKKRPVFRPTQKAAPAPLSEEEQQKVESAEPVPIAPITTEKADDQASAEAVPPSEAAPKRPAGFRPTMKPPQAVAADPAAEKTAKPAFRPTVKPPKSADIPPAEATDATETPTPSIVPTAAAAPSTEKPRSGFRPTMKPAKPVDTPPPADESAPSEPARPAMPKPAFRPTMKPAATARPAESEETHPEAEPRPAEPAPKAFRPTMKPKPADTPLSAETEPLATADPSTSETSAPVPPKAKPTFRPTMKPAANPTPGKPEETIPAQAQAEENRAETSPSDAGTSARETQELPTHPKPAPKAFRPTMKPAKPVDTPLPADVTSAEEGAGLPAERSEPPKPKPAFRPTMKPKPKDDAN